VGARSLAELKETAMIARLINRAAHAGILALGVTAAGIGCAPPAAANLAVTNDWRITCLDT
jgi:hypothetical protein